MPVIGVANGPATVHSEYLLLSDIHIASEPVRGGPGRMASDFAGYSHRKKRFAR
jgi:hypothetical protein